MKIVIYLESVLSAANTNGWMNESLTLEQDLVQ